MNATMQSYYKVALCIVDLMLKTIDARFTEIVLVSRVVLFSQFCNNAISRSDYVY